MNHDKKWYLAWTPGDPEYARDDIIFAVGLKCASTPHSLPDVIAWLGTPDKVTGNPQSGHLAYYFNCQQETAAFFDVINAMVRGFGTIARHQPNSKRIVDPPGEEIVFNVFEALAKPRQEPVREAADPPDSPRTVGFRNGRDGGLAVHRGSARAS